MQSLGLITLMGSGESSPSGRPLFEAAFSGLPRPVKVAIMETPAGFEPNSAYVANRISQSIEHRLQNYKPEVTVIPARRKDSPCGSNNPDILRPLLDADCIFMGPGSPSYAVRHLAGSLAWDMIQARHRLGASLAFSSSGAIAVGKRAIPIYEIYKVGDDPHWIPGLDLLGRMGIDIACVTHWNNAEGGVHLDTSRCYIGRARLESMLATIPSGTTIVGIDEHTALTLDFAERTCRVVGKGGVILIEEGEERIFGSGSQFSMDELGDFHLPDPLDGIAPDVWAEATAARSRTQTEGSVLPDAAAAAIADREEARRRKDWKRADDLRDQLLDMGYRIMDTPEGPKWEAI